MIIKMQTEAHQDRFLVEAAFINWEYLEGEAYVILEIHVVATQTKRAGTTSLSFSGIEEEPSLRMKIYDGDNVYIMNDAGKTIDSKRIRLQKDKCETCAIRRTCDTTTNNIACVDYAAEICDGCIHIKDEWCKKHDKKILSLSSRRCDLWEWKGPS